MDEIFSKQQRISLRDSNSKINIWQGAVRSGKTYISLWRFIKEITMDKKEVEGEFVIVARTYDSIKRNLIPLLYEMIGSSFQYYIGKREAYMYGRRIHLVGAEDERAESKIRGATFIGAYVDEATILPESVFKMLVSRCAMKDARIFVTTNPDSPFHWLKKDYIDNNDDVAQWQFTLQDNPKLTQESKDYLSRQYKGIWYQRFILGNWVQASGAIFDFFDLDIHVIKKIPSPAVYSILGIDYGTSNPTTFILISYNPGKYPNMWVEKEYVWDSREKQRQKTDAEYAQDLQSFINGYRINGIYLDPSAASFRLELIRANIKIKHAENEVLDGIRFLSNLFGSGTLKICDTCPTLIKEMQSYVWDPKSIQRGEDKPLKTNDHTIDALRYAVYTHFFKRNNVPIDWDKEFREAVNADQNIPSVFQQPDPSHQYFM